MRAFLKRPDAVTRIEFWAATTLFAFVVFFFISDGLYDETNLRYVPYLSSFEKVGMPFRFYKHYFIPQLLNHIFLFLSFSYLNFMVVPQLVRRHAVVRNTLLLVLVFIAAGLFYGVTDTYLKAYLYREYGGRDAADQYIFRHSFLYAFFLLRALAFYTAIRYAGLYLLHNAEALQSRYRFLRREALVVFIIWAICLFLLDIGGGEREIIAMWTISVPSALLIYLAGFYRIIPDSLKERFPFTFYLVKNMLLLLVLSIVNFALLTFLIGNENPADGISMLNGLIQFFVVVPATWMLYKRHLKGSEEVKVLQKELKQSNASFDFLRSQINPHFLFNALNTLYGTALQEGAERTSEGIEKLGGMMRFMLQENMQEAIPLTREIEYLNNYINLQKLRTDAVPGVTIEAQIAEPIAPVTIAPMLLIPFVENAFKHGISFREPSFIRIHLELQGNTLYFDVHNSRHEKVGSDPERDRSGIGLANVKQRLQLLYGSRHELTIRETGKAFFIHLTLQLT